MKLKKGSTRGNEQEKDLLWRSETRFQRIFDYSNDAIFVIDPESDEILNANSMASKMLGFSHDELLATPISAIHPDEMPQLRSFVDSVFTKGSGWTDELTCLTKHGETLAAEISASVFEIDGRPCVLAMVRNIAERKQAEQALRESEERYRAIYNHTPVMMHSIDHAGRLISVNDHWLTVLGYDRDGVIGRKSIEFLTAESADRAAEQEIPRIYREGRVANVELQMVKKNGEVIDVMISAVAEHDDAGEITHSLAIIVDLTERKQAEQALRESENRLASIVGSAMDAIVTIDKDRTILLANAAAENIFGCRTADLVHQSFDHFAPDTLRELMVRSVDAFEQGGSGQQYLWAPDGITASRANGEEFPIEATISQAKAAGEKLYTIILRDVNERVRAEQVLERLHFENEYLREEAETELEFEEIVGSSPPIRAVLQSVRQVAGTDSTVLLTGETGTGKELIAGAIHKLSGRKNNLLVKVNCAALPSGLIESELFGHEKGAFTGALSRKIGRFELADGGTIFLDEIGDLPLELQAKLLRVLQEGEFDRVGGTATLKADVRVIAATNLELETAVQEKQFRPDLYYRINIFPIRVPPLRERKEDISLLARHFVMELSNKMGKKVEKISKATMDALMAYAWPGNIRELNNVIERAVILSQGSQLELGDWLPKASVTPSRSQVLNLEELERQHIAEILEMSGWRVSGTNGAAKILGIKPTTLESKMKRLGINRPAG